MTLVSSLLLLFIIVVLVNEFYQSRLGVPCTPTLPEVRRRMIAHLPDRGDIVELGSGWGGIAIAAAKARPEARVTGVEYSIFPYLFSRLRPKPQNLVFTRADFFAYPLHNAAAVLCYLTNPLMEKLRPKFMSELKPGAKIISSTFFIPEWTPIATEEIKGPWTVPVFIYEKS